MLSRLACVKYESDPTILETLFQEFKAEDRSCSN